MSKKTQMKVAVVSNSGEVSFLHLELEPNHKSWSEAMKRVGDMPLFEDRDVSSVTCFIGREVTTYHGRSEVYEVLGWEE